LASASTGRKWCTSFKTVGSCTPNWRALPTTEPHAVAAARWFKSIRLPKKMREKIIAAFQATGAV
jgi:hypothetical protein